MKDLRRTGRTHRMMQDAFRIAAKGKGVYIAVADESRAAALCAQYKHRLVGTGIKIEAAHRFRTLDMHTFELKGARNCCVLVDHNTIERYYDRVLEMLHRYDPPEVEPIEEVLLQTKSAPFGFTGFGILSKEEVSSLVRNPDAMEWRFLIYPVDVFHDLKPQIEQWLKVNSAARLYTITDKIVRVEWAHIPNGEKTA